MLLILLTLWMPLAEARLPLPKQLTSMDSALSKNQYFLPLLSHFVTQKNQGYCAVASAVMVLNSLQIAAPIDDAYQPYAYFTQDDFFNDKIRAIVTENQVAKTGMTLQMLTHVLNTFPVHATAHFSNNQSIQKIKAGLVKSVTTKNTLVIVNFDREVLGQEGHGHFSPIAAYQASTDQFLILDVARYKYPPFWVNAKELVRATEGFDSDSKQTRGYITIEK